MFAVILTGAPGSGKTVCLTALSDALVDDQIAHAAVDSDEVAWAYPFPDLAQRAEHVRALWDSHRRTGQDLLVLAEVIESPGHLNDLLALLGADDHLLVRLEAAPATLRERILGREPEGWSSLDYLLDYTERIAAPLAGLDGVHLALDSESLSPAQIAERVRAARPDKLSPGVA